MNTFNGTLAEAKRDLETILEFVQSLPNDIEKNLLTGNLDGRLVKTAVFKNIEKATSIYMNKALWEGIKADRNLLLKSKQAEDHILNALIKLVSTGNEEARTVAHEILYKHGDSQSIYSKRIELESAIDPAYINKPTRNFSMADYNYQLFKHLAYPLKNCGFDPYSACIIVTRIAFEIFKIQNAPLAHREDGLNMRFRKNEIKYLCPVPLQNMTFNLHCQLDSTLEIKEIQIHLYFPSSLPGAKVFTGGWKKVKKSFTLILPKGDIRLTQVIPSVVQRFKKDCDQDDFDQALGGIKIQKEINSIFEEQYQLAAAPCIVPYKSKNSTDKYEFVQKCYNGNLAKALFPICLKPHFSSDVITINKIEVLDILINCAMTLHKMHKNGLVHGDVKSNNILIDINDSLQVKGVLSDVDFTQLLGKAAFQPTEHFIYWDKCRDLQLILPSSDLHGLAYTVAESLLPLHCDALTSPNFGGDVFAQGKILLEAAYFNIKCRCIPELQNTLSQLALLKSPFMFDVLYLLENEFKQEMEKPSCTESLKEELKCIKALMKGYHKAIQLLVNQIRLDHLLWEKLEANYIWRVILMRGTVEEKLLIYDQLTQSIPGYPTAEDIGNRIKEIKNLFLTGQPDFPSAA